MLVDLQPQCIVGTYVLERSLKSGQMYKWRKRGNPANDKQHFDDIYFFANFCRGIRERKFPECRGKENGSNGKEGLWFYNLTTAYNSPVPGIDSLVKRFFSLYMSRWFMSNVVILYPDKYGSFVRFIRGGGWLLAVFWRAFSYRQRWGLDMAQCAIPL